MTGRIEQIAVGRPRTVRHNGKDVSTGIWKSPVGNRVAVTSNGIEGDGQADLTVHGGRDKAVYVYPQAHYAAWIRDLGVAELEPAQFGENLTVSGVDDDTVAVGDRFRFGSVVAVVSQPRLPCFKLGIRMGDASFPARFLASGRLGFYLRVEEPGTAEAGDAFERIERAAHGITVTELWRIVFGRDDRAADAARCLEAMPYLDDGWQGRLRLKAGGAG